MPSTTLVPMLSVSSLSPVLWPAMPFLHMKAASSVRRGTPGCRNRTIGLDDAALSRTCQDKPSAPFPVTGLGCAQAAGWYSYFQKSAPGGVLRPGVGCGRCTSCCCSYCSRSTPAEHMAPHRGEETMPQSAYKFRQDTLPEVSCLSLVPGQHCMKLKTLHADWAIPYMPSLQSVGLAGRGGSRVRMWKC